MTNKNYVILIGAYDDETEANKDLEALKAADDITVVAAIVASRGADGVVEVKEHSGRLFVPGTAVGAVAGLLIGLFAPPLLLPLAAVGAGMGAGATALAKRHQEKKIGVDVEEWLPVGASVLIAVADDIYADRLHDAMKRATKKVSKAVDKGDYRAVARAVAEGDEKIFEALNA